MSTWAYCCRPCGGNAEWWVARERIDEMPPDVRIVRVQVGDDWPCARVDRSRPVAVEAMLLREAVASDLQDCPGCAEREAPAASPPAAAPVVPAAATPGAGTAPAAGGVQVQAAAVSIADRRFVVVLVPLEVVRSPGEADMLLADLRPRFGGAELVAMGQADDGTPEYHGDAVLLALLAGVPVDRLPWKSYTLG